MYSSLKIHWKNFSTIKVKKLRLNQVDSTTIYANSFYLKIMQVFCDQIDKASNNFQSHITSGNADFIRYITCQIL